MGVRNLKNILGISGIRSELDILLPAIAPMSLSDQFDVGLVLTGANLASDFKNYQIPSDLRVVERLPTLIDCPDDYARSIGLGNLVQMLSVTVDRLRPDILIVVGDREESIATAIVGGYTNTLVAHLAGGDRVIGNIDDSVRHAVSKLAHVHFPFSQKSAKRLELMGEESWRIQMSGNPALDGISQVEKLSRQDIATELGLKNCEKSIYTVIFHPISSEHRNAGTQARVLLTALAKVDGYKVLIRPNTDPGSERIKSVFEQFNQNQDFLYADSLPRKIFVNLLRHSDVLIGNSSAGLLEAPFLGLPALNVGNRQKYREQAGNVVYVSCSETEILAGLRTCRSSEHKEKVQSSQFHFGEGNSGQVIMETLGAIHDHSKWLLKDITYE